MDRLPAIVKSRAAGGPQTPLFPPAVRTPEDTFGVLRDLLYSLESRLQVVQTDVERRHALAEDALHLADARVADRQLRPPPRSVHGRRRLPHRARHLGRSRRAGLRHRRRHRRSSGTIGRVRQHGGRQPRLWYLDALRAPVAICGDRRRSGAARRSGRLRRRHRRATGDHLHYEVLVHGRQLNPLRFLVNRAKP